jgi:DNA recombination protein RmuC
MGFRTLAIQERSSEVWRTLGAVKTEFGKFGTVLDGVQKKLREASDKIDQTKTRTNVLTRKLRDVEALPNGETQQLLGLALDDEPDDDA